MSIVARAHVLDDMRRIAEGRVIAVTPVPVVPIPGSERMN